MSRIKLIPFTCLPFCFLCCYGQPSQIEAIQRTLPRIRDSMLYVDVLNRLAMLSYEKNIDSTFYYTKEAREIADRLQYPQGKADALNNLGIVYDIKGNVQLALRYYNEAYLSYLTLHDSSNVVQTLMNIAGVYQQNGKDEKAIVRYKEALTLGSQLSRDSILSLVIFNYLSKYTAEIPKDSVKGYFEKARRIARKYKDDRVLLVLEQITADDAIRNHRREEGINLLRQIIGKAISNRLYFLSLDLLIDAGDQLAQSDPAMAVNYYKQGLALSLEKGYLIYSQVMARKLYDFFTDRRDSAAAYGYSRQLIQLNGEQDKLNNESGVDYIDYALKDQQLESFRVRATYQSALLVLAGIICFMTIGIIIILWRNWKKTQRTASALRLQFEQSEATTAALDTMNKNYSKLLKVVAHDLRNPVGAISTISSLLSRDESGTGQGQFIRMIQTSAQISLNLINELLETDFDQQQHLEKEQLSLGELLEQCVGLLRFKARDKKQRILLDSDEGLILRLDREKISRVMNNLVTNAIKFSPEDSDIAVTARKRGATILISVKDAGIGIPADLQAKIFDPFTTAKRKGTGGEQAFGLGLYISKQLIEAHHGIISVRSEPGKGTEFLVELPC